jgi:L-malate glycosyltransferase
MELVLNGNLTKSMHDKLSICLVIDTIDSPTAGTEKQLLLLIKHLDRAGFTPHLCVLRNSTWLNEKFDLCPLHVVGIDSFKNPISFFKLLKFSRLLREKRIDIVQTHFRDSTIAGIIAARLAGINKVICSRRNQGFWMNGREVAIQKFLNRWVTHFIANSVSTKDWVVQSEGVEPERVKVIYNAIDLTPYERLSVVDRLAMRRELGIADKTAVVGIVANLRPVKGVDVFLRAATFVRKQIPDVRFLVIGEGNERSRLEALSRELRIDDVVIFLGRREDIERILTAFDVGVLSSHSESFSNSIVEYMATGLPVVCTDAGGCREAIDGYGHGKVVAVNDHAELGAAIVSFIYECSTYRCRYSREWVNKTYGITTFLQETTEIYRSVSTHKF